MDYVPDSNQLWIIMPIALQTFYIINTNIKQEQSVYRNPTSINHNQYSHAKFMIFVKKNIDLYMNKKDLSFLCFKSF